MGRRAWTCCLRPGEERGRLVESLLQFLSGPSCRRSAARRASLCSLPPCPTPPNLTKTTPRRDAEGEVRVWDLQQRRAVLSRALHDAQAGVLHLAVVGGGEGGGEGEPPPALLLR